MKHLRHMKFVHLPKMEDYNGGLRGQRGETRALRAGFSLVEIMVVMAMLSVIVLGLFSVFNQTQRALKSNNAQVDVMEAGRNAFDMITREIEQAVAPNLYTNDNYALRYFYPLVQYVQPDTHRGFTMQLNDGTVRTNILHEVFFLSRSNNWLTANGFFLGSITNVQVGKEMVPRYVTNEVAQTGVGMLFRCSVQNNPRLMDFRTLDKYYQLTNLYGISRTNMVANYPYGAAYPLVDGVVHFRVLTYDGQMRLLNEYLTNQISLSITNPVCTLVRDPDIPGEIRPFFTSNNLPAYVEVELGLLSPQVLQKARSIPNVASQRSFLTNQAHAVLFFRKMIRLRNAQNEL